MGTGERRSATVALVVLVVCGVVLALLLAACALRLGGRAIPYLCPPPANYTVVRATYVRHGGAIRRAAGHNAADRNNLDRALYGCPFAPKPTPSNELIDQNGLA
jgi:hypothetical protein